MNGYVSYFLRALNQQNAKPKIKQLLLEHNTLNILGFFEQMGLCEGNQNFGHYICGMNTQISQRKSFACEAM